MKRDFELIQTLTNTKTPASKSPRDNSLGNSTQEAKSIESDEREMINVINYTDKMPNLDLIQIRQASAASKSSKERVLTEANTMLREGSKTQTGGFDLNKVKAKAKVKDMRLSSRKSSVIVAVP